MKLIIINLVLMYLVLFFGEKIGMRRVDIIIAVVLFFLFVTFLVGYDIGKIDGRYEMYLEENEEGR